MRNKDFKKAMVHEALILMGLLVLLTFVTRLWPILLLVILGIFIAVIRLLFLSAKQPEEPILALPPAKQVHHQMDLEAMAFMLVQRRVTQILCDQYPDVRWIWENARAREDLFAGRDLYVLLNRAGGYRRAKVIVRELQVFDVVVQKDQIPVKKDIIESTVAMQKAEEPTADTAEELSAEAVPDEQPVPEDFGLMAFQWVETHILELSGRCNEAIAAGCHELEIPEEELPVRESWEEICKELARNDLPDSKISDNGIKIKF